MTMQKIAFAVLLGMVAFVLAGEPANKRKAACHCDCYWQGKEDGRNEVRKANAELLKPIEQEWPEGTEKPWWADRPAVN